MRHVGGTGWRLQSSNPSPREIYCCDQQRAKPREYSQMKWFQCDQRHIVKAGLRCQTNCKMLVRLSNEAYATTRTRDCLEKHCTSLHTGQYWEPSIVELLGLVSVWKMSTRKTDDLEMGEAMVLLNECVPNYIFCGSMNRGRSKRTTLCHSKHDMDNSCTELIDVGPPGREPHSKTRT